jgi:hypothetical protein
VTPCRFVTTMPMSPMLVCVDTVAAIVPLREIEYAEMS